MYSYAFLRIFIAFIIDYSTRENNSVISSSAFCLKDPLLPRSHKKNSYWRLKKEEWTIYWEEFKLF